MRIVGGRLKGRTLAGPAPNDRSIRPTSDRLREAIFNVLAHRHGDPVPGARVLDLFAGTGAMAFEALSRGAAFATLVESGSAACGLIRVNIDALGLGKEALLLRRDATHPGVAPASGPATLVFCDPPYGQGLGEAALLSCLGGGWLSPGALAVVEELEGAFAWPAPFIELDRRTYGDTAVAFGRLPPEGEPITFP